MLIGIWDLLFHPDAFFARVSKERINQIPPLIIIGTGIFFFSIIHLMALIFPNRGGWSFLVFQGLAQKIIVSLITASVVKPMIIWGLFSIVFYCISRVAGGTGSFYATIQNVGYGMLPWSVSVIVPFIAYVYNFVSYTGGPVIGGYCGIWLMHPIVCSLPLLGVMVWSCYLWTIAVRYTHGLPLKKAAVITIVPVSVFLFISLLPELCYFWRLCL
jgi:hypothetical protein